jgi:N-methylhydantoinase A
MQSSGGILPGSAIRQRPTEMLNSGPAAGVIAAIRVAARLGDPDLITLDMGGTSTDVCLVRNGAAELTSERMLDGLPVGMPSVDIANVGAGGGSIALIDRGGMLQVGPRSAGAIPGPACYGHGGQDPALTDAAVQLGWLRPHRFLGGRMALHPENATAALAPLASALAGSINSIAGAIVDIGVAHIERAVRLVSVQRGQDPRGHALYAYGGMGPLTGALVAEQMRISRVVVPPYPGLFSALGLLVADLERTYRLTSFAPLTAESLPVVVAHFDGLRTEAWREFAGYGYAADQVQVETHLEMRYRGQGFELVSPVDLERLGRDGVADLVDTFHAAHLTRYGARAPVDAIEIVTYRLVARVPGGRAALEQLGAATAAGEVRQEEMPVIFRGEATPCRFLWRESLPLGYTEAGLAIIEEPTATTLVPPGWRFEIGPLGAILLTRDEGGA